jgi:CheY-like chemotaxis protein
VSPETRILVVEDDRAIGEGLRDGLTGNGYRVDWHRTGLAAKEAFDVVEPDLVLLDIGLPDTDGFSLCRWMRQQRHDLPIVLVTARDADIDVIVGLDAGATDYVTKPFSLNGSGPTSGPSSPRPPPRTGSAPSMSTRSRTRFGSAVSAWSCASGNSNFSPTSRPALGRW